MSAGHKPSLTSTPDGMTAQTVSHQSFRSTGFVPDPFCLCPQHDTDQAAAVVVVVEEEGYYPTCLLCASPLLTPQPSYKKLLLRLLQLHKLELMPTGNYICIYICIYFYFMILLLLITFSSAQYILLSDF